MADKDQEIHALRSLVASTAEELETARLRLTCAWAPIFSFFAHPALGADTGLQWGWGKIGPISNSVTKW